MPERLTQTPRPDSCGAGLLHVSDVSLRDMRVVLWVPGCAAIIPPSLRAPKGKGQPNGPAFLSVCDSSI